MDGARPTGIHALAFGCFDALTLPVADQVPLKLGDSPEQVKQQAPRGCLGFYVLVQDDQGDPFSLQPLRDLAQMDNRPRKAVQSRADQHISLADVFEAGMKLWSRTVCAALAFRENFIAVCEFFKLEGK